MPYRRNKIKDQRGVALLATVFFLSLFFILSIYFLDLSMNEKKISRSSQKGNITYYLAEAGIEEMIWRLKNNDDYKDSFEANPSWEESFSRDDPFGPGSGSYTVSIENNGLARGSIISTGMASTSEGNTSRRIVKTEVYRAIATSTSISDNAVFTNNNTDILLSKLNLATSSLHSNNNVEVNGVGTELNIDNDLGAVNEFYESFWATVNVGGDISDSVNYPPAPDPEDMIGVSFDEPSDPQSLKNRADIVYTESDFEDLLSGAGSSLTLNGITYVEGDIIFDEDLDVTVNGLLVAEGDIHIGEACWLLFCCGNHTSLVVNSQPGEPSGLIADGDIEFDFCTKSSDIEGVVYATQKVELTNFSDDIDIVGGVHARDFFTVSVWQPVDITYDSDITTDTLVETEFSPVVTVEHWEEEY